MIEKENKRSIMEIKQLKLYFKENFKYQVILFGRKFAVNPEVTYFLS